MSGPFDLPGDPSLPPGVTRGMINRYGLRCEEEDAYLYRLEQAEIEADKYDEFLDALEEERQREWADDVERRANETAAHARTMGEAA